MAELNKLKSKKSWNKKDLSVLLASQANIPKVHAANYINILTTTIAEALERGKKVTISDFGTFQVSTRNSFGGRNPKTLQELTVPVRRIPVFRAGKKLKNALNIPQVKSATLMGSKKIQVVFSKLMSETEVGLLDAKSYGILVDKKSAGSVVSVELETKTSRTRILKDKDSNDPKQTTENTISGVESVILTCDKAIKGDVLKVVFRKALKDVDGNVTVISKK